MHALRLRSVLSLLAVVTTLFAPTIASADPATFVAPSDPTISVTLSDTTLYPGQRVYLSGNGFAGTQPNPGDPDDLPLIAIKPYDVDRLDFLWGSDTGHTGDGGADSYTWFVSKDPGGSWKGWIQIPTTVDPAGVDANDGAGGQHWFRILSGAFSTTGGGNPFVGNVGPVVTYRLPFTIVDRDPIGLVAPNGTTFQPGATFRPGAPIAPRLTEFPASRPITATLEDGTNVPVTSGGQPAETTATGTFSATTRATLPTGTAPGAHQLTFSVAPSSGAPVTTTYAISVTAAPNVTISTPAVRPGGQVNVSLTGFIGVGGAGQKVAVVSNEQVLSCITTSSAGAASTVVTIPATAADGTLGLNFTTGTSCQGPAGAQNDLPAGLIARSVTVKADAPIATSTSSGLRGGTIEFSGSGFPPSGAVIVALDGQTVPVDVTATSTGTFAGSFKVPADAAAGEHVLTFTSGTAVATSAFTVTVPEPTPAPTPAPAATATPIVLPPPATPAPTPVRTPTPVPVAPAPKTATLKGDKLTLTLAGAAVKGTKIQIATASKVKLTKTGKAKTVVLTKATTNTSGKITLKLTAEGKKALRRYGKLKVKITVTVPGTKKPATKTVTLRR